MPPPSSFTFYDTRSGDTFVIELEDGDFAYALRYVIGIGRDPIQYNHLIDVPEPHRSTIEHKISKRCQLT